MFGACPILGKVLVKVIHHIAVAIRVGHGHDQFVGGPPRVEGYHTARTPGHALTLLARQSRPIGPVRAAIVITTKVTHIVFVYGLVTDEEVLRRRSILVDIHGIVRRSGIVVVVIIIVVEVVSVVLKERGVVDGASGREGEIGERRCDFHILHDSEIR